MSETPFAGECCADMVTAKSWMVEHDKKHVTLEAILDRLLNRLPIWVTVAFTLAGAIVGSLLTIIIILLNQLGR